MSELGLAFDDDDLDNHKKKHDLARDIPYHVKIVAPTWFDQEVEPSPQQKPFVLKFRGDHCYRLGDYAGAAQHYQAALDVLPDNNVAVSQDLRESLSRCHAYLGSYCDALKIARDMVKEANVEDEARQRQTLNLLCFVCEKTGLWKESISCLERLCILQPSFPQTWLQLAESVAQLVKADGSNPSQTGIEERDSIHPHAQVIRSIQSNEPQLNSQPLASEPGSKKDTSDDDCQKSTKERSLLIILTCYIHAKLLLDSVLANASEFIKARNKRWILEVTEKINSLPLPEDIKEKAFQVGRRQLNSCPDKFEPQARGEGAEKIDEAYNIVSTDFYKRFCSWHL